MMLRERMGTTEPRMIEAFRLRWVERHTWVQIGEMLDVTRTRASQMGLQGWAILHRDSMHHHPLRGLAELVRPLHDQKRLDFWLAQEAQRDR